MQALQTKTAENETVWSPTQVQFLYGHKNGRYYVRTYAGGKGNGTSLRTKLLSVAKNRMKEHVEAVERHRTTGNSVEAVEAVGKLTFGEAIHSYREQLAASDVRPNTKAYREAGVKLVLRSWGGVEALNVRRITSKTVEEWAAPLQSGSGSGACERTKSATSGSSSTLVFIED